MTSVSAQSVYIFAQNKATKQLKVHGKCEHISICDHLSTKVTQLWGKR